MSVNYGLPPELKRLASVYEFIAPGDFAALGVDPEDVPLGSFPALNHPPFLPDRFGGNAYGLGVFEYSVLTTAEVGLLESLDLTDTHKVKEHYRDLNLILKRLGLLIRFSTLGNPYYLIPRQYIIHFSAEIQATADWIESSLKPVEARDLACIALIGNQTGLLVSELQTRLPRSSFSVLATLDDFLHQEHRFQYVIFLNPPSQLELLNNVLPSPAAGQKGDEDIAVFVAGLAYDLLEDDGELLLVCDSPNLNTAQVMEVRFSRQDEYKRFLLFSHIYRTKRRYHSREGLRLQVNSLDFYTFLIAQGLYYEALESMLNGAPLPRVTPPEIDALPYQDLPLPLPLNTGPEQQNYWRKGLTHFFNISQLDNILPPAQAKSMQEGFGIKDQIMLQTLLVGKARKRLKPVRFEELAHKAELEFLIGCPQNLLAAYKNTFDYLLKTLDVVKDISEKKFPGLSKRQGAMLLGALESSTPFVQDARRLVAMTAELRRLEAKLNPQHILGPGTLVLENLEKLGMLGLDEGLLGQIYLTILGHSTLGRVCFGKFSENSLAPLADISRYNSLEEAISIINLCRLFSLAEVATSTTKQFLHPNLQEEIFSLGLTAIRVVTDPYTTWDDIEQEQEAAQGGLRPKVIRKMLCLFKMFNFLNTWPQLTTAGSFQREVISAFDAETLEKANRFVALHKHIQHLLEIFYIGDTLSRPYFFRAFLDTRLHGASRLMPYLGGQAAFNFLWICVHVTNVRAINLNLLPDPQNPEQVDALNKMRANLENLSLHALGPEMLSSLRQNMLRQRKTYLYDTGVYLVVDEENGVLVPYFLDSEQAMLELELATAMALNRPMEHITNKQFTGLDNTYKALEEYLQATHAPDAGFAEFKSRFLNYLLEQLFDLPKMAERLQRLNSYCPYLTNEIMNTSTQARKNLPVLMAEKLNSLLMDQPEDFQNMQLSYEAAIAEFGPSATGIVGVSNAQFEQITKQLQVALYNKPGLSQTIILGALLASQKAPRRAYRTLKKKPFFEQLDNNISEDDLLFLIDNYKLPRRIISGEAPLSALSPLLGMPSEDLLNATFVFSIIYTAARQEGLLTEDFLDKFLILKQSLDEWRKADFDATQTAWTEMERRRLSHDALGNYLNGLDGYGVVPQEEEFSQCHSSSVPDEHTAALAAFDRLLKLCGLYLVSGLDIKMSEQSVPEAFIYRNKRIRSFGMASFNRQLAAGMAINEILKSNAFLADKILPWLGADNPVIIITNFAELAAKLLPLSQMKLLALSLMPIKYLTNESHAEIKVSFSQLNNLDIDRLNMLEQTLQNKATTQLLTSPVYTVEDGYAIDFLQITIDRDKRLIKVDLTDMAFLQDKISILETTENIDELITRYKEARSDLQAFLPKLADKYLAELQSVYNKSLNLLADSFLDNARLIMSQTVTVNQLNDLLHSFNQKGKRFPARRLQTLNDLYEINLERLHANLLEQTTNRLSSVATLAELDKLWFDTRPLLDTPQTMHSSNLSLSIAQLFDRRRQELLDNMELSTII